MLALIDTLTRRSSWRKRLCSGQAAALACLVLAGAWPGAQPAAADWRAPVRGGGEVYVDPATNRALLYRGGHAVPLWDGTHFLGDGSVLIIRQGMVVPNTGVLQARRQPLPPQEQPVQPSPCERLVAEVCGQDGRCAASPGCGAARQLLMMEREERRAATGVSAVTYTGGQCQYARSDRAYFPNCARP